MIYNTERLLGVSTHLCVPDFTLDRSFSALVTASAALQPRCVHMHVASQGTEIKHFKAA